MKKNSLILLVLFGAFSARAAEPPCGAVAARWDSFEATGAEIDYWETQGSIAFPYQSLSTTNPETEVFKGYREICRSRAIDVLVDDSLAAEARRRGLALSQDDASRCRDRAASAALQAYERRAAEMFQPTAEEVARATALSETSGPAEPLYQLRVVIRRKAPGVDVEEERERLIQIRAGLHDGSLDPEHAVMYYSQAESAQDKGLLEPRPLAQIPPNTRAAVANLSEGEWTDVMESDLALSLVQVAQIRTPLQASQQARAEVAREKLFRAFIDELAEKELRVRTDSSLYPERALEFAEAHVLSADFAPACVRRWMETMLLADAYAAARAREMWDAADETQRRAWFLKHETVFRRFWELERTEYLLFPAEPKLAFQRSYREVEDIWKKDIVPKIVQYRDGNYTGSPIPEGWALRATPKNLQFITEPSRKTPCPPDQPEWRNGALYSEGIAGVRREGGKDTPCFEWDEVPASQREAMLLNELAADVRKEASAAATPKIEWLAPLKE